jgi:putative PIN family toxin of toxin-antitoxin system
VKNIPQKSRVVLDTNIVISALIFGGVPQKVTDHIVDKAFRPVMSEELMTELRRVVTEKFPRARHELEIYEKLLRRYAVWVVLGNRRVVVSRDPDDDKFIETALVGECQYIVSGDNDLLSLKKYQNIKIISASEFLSLIKE